MFASCVSGQLVEKSEYQNSILQLKQQNPEAALVQFPQKENKQFITTLEKAYLSLIVPNQILSKDNLDLLLKYSKEIEKKEVVILSDELKNLFYVETSEGYFPAEHEIFWLHLVLGMHFMKMNQPEKVRIEAQKISEIYRRINSKGEAYFDDVSLRVLSATLWIYVGEWNRAQVDLKRALALNSKLNYLKTIVENEKPPRHWNLYFRGSGVEARTSDLSSDQNPTGFTHLAFQSSLTESYLFSQPQWQERLIGDTNKWYLRHVTRNHEIKQTLETSKYMSRMLKSELEYGSLSVLTTAATGSIVVVGVAAGIAIVGGGIYLLGSTASGDAYTSVFLLGYLVGNVIYDFGIKFYRKTKNKIETERSNYQDVSRFYRYVRFIPNQFYLFADENRENFESIKFTSGILPFINVKAHGSATSSLNTKMNVYFVAD